MISIPGKVLREIWEHGESAYPEEGAGVLIGRAEGDIRFVDQILPLSNQFETELRHRRYMITPEDMIDAEEFADDRGLEIIGIFHSHPDHPAQPSEFDRDRALPWYSYIITSVHNRNAVESRSWRLTEERKFREEELLFERKSALEKK
jgi:proteasome lid subunit RPN8/RPN11